MGINFKTARNMADAHDRQFNKADSIYFTNRGWTEFSEWLEGEYPEVRDILARFLGPVDNHPDHETLTHDGRPLSLAFTADECRRLFVAISATSQDGMRKEYDFWQFASLVAVGIIEDGITSY
jgi:hypothetical protein